MSTDPLLHSTPNEDLPHSAAELYDRAFELYGSMVFWNMKPHRDINGCRSAIRALKEHGDMAAARLAVQMEQAIDHAA